MLTLLGCRCRALELVSVRGVGAGEKEFFFFFFFFAVAEPAQATKFFLFFFLLGSPLGLAAWSPVTWGCREDRLLTRGGWIGLFDGLQELFGHLQSPCEVGRTGQILDRIRVVFAREGLLMFVAFRYLD